MKSFTFDRKLADGSSYRLGVAVEYPDGWRFISNVTSHKSSRKFHRTMLKCVPRWVGYPDKCESTPVNPTEPVRVVDPWRRDLPVLGMA